mmetsp:Transcript_19597/g.65855  ORF Transcript_19597/g.65855 Transcript_19597/m.65855 type:complete len:101 (-) Transcript_19597:491-793(-)
MAPRSSFKQEHAFEKRQAEAERIRSKYPDRIPVICERAEKTDIPDIDKKKCARRAGPLRALCALEWPRGPLYESNKDEDGFLYITYSGENTFGALGLEEL